MRWCYAQDRRIQRHLGIGAGKGFCIDHGVKPTTSFILAIIMLAGDVCPNSGPRNIRNPCGICRKGVKSNQGGICCDQCNICFTQVSHAPGNIRLSYNSARDPSETFFTVSQPDMYENLSTTLGKAGLKLAHINVRGLLGKFNEITLLLEESNIDILAITKIHLDRSVRNETVKITVYEVQRHDRDKNGEGCLLYWKENLDVTL